MRVESLTIRSYKSFFEEITIPFSPRLNVFIGPNNCGKTNVLNAIDFLTHPEKDPLRLHHHRSDLALLVHLDADEQKAFSGVNGLALRGKQYAVACTDRNGRTVSADLSHYVMNRIKMLHYDDFGDLEQIGRDYSMLAEKHPAVFQRLTRLLQTYFPEVKSIERLVDEEAERFGTVMMEQGSITIERLGGGFRRVLVILIYALHPDYSVLMIDEPEIHLHPGMIKKLLRVLISSATNQIIVTSHSPLFVTAATLHQVYRVLKDEQGSHIYSLALGTLSIDKHRLVQELNADNLEMFFADKILLVEGV